MSSHAHVKLADCGSLIYDSCVMLLALAPDSCKSLPIDVCKGARGAILRAWTSDFEAGELRGGDGRYGHEFGIMMELMAKSGADGSSSSSSIAATDIVAVGYVSAAVARHALTYTSGVGGINSNSNHHFRFRAALATFFRALLNCDDVPASVDALIEVAARCGIPHRVCTHVCVCLSVCLSVCVFGWVVVWVGG